MICLKTSVAFDDQSPDPGTFRSLESDLFVRYVTCGAGFEKVEQSSSPVHIPYLKCGTVMHQAARVLSVEALEEFRAALDHFVEVAKDALGANDMEVQRAAAWLGEQLKHWQKELRVRQEELIVAKNNLKRRQLIKFNGRPPDCTEQEAAFELARRRVREAEEKLANCKRWVPLLQRETDQYIGHVRPLAGVLEVDLPRFSGNFKQRIAALHAYVQMAPPTPEAAPAEPAAPEPPAAG
jgi:hypothetical protein